MYLSRIHLNHSRAAQFWLSNPYRIHQRLMMACEGDPRLLFRLEETENSVQLLVQSQHEPDWQVAFIDLPVLDRPPECKSFTLRLPQGLPLRFRLLANPTVKKTQVHADGKETKTRLGLIHEADQEAWLRRKLDAAGADLLDCRITPRGVQHSRKPAAKGEGSQSHLAVLFEGVLRVRDSAALETALAEGFGSGKGFGFGLLSLAPM